MATDPKRQARRKKRVGSSKSARVAGSRSKPKVEFDLEDLERWAAIGCTPEDMAPALGVAPSTLYKHMAENPAVQRAIDDGRATMRRNLRTAQLRAAIAGNPTMMIWLGKQELSQVDRKAVEVTGADGGPLEFQSDLVPVLERKLEQFIRSKRGSDG